MPPDPDDDDLKGSEARLWRLIAERTRPGAPVAEIDERIWDLFGEDWAVMFTDLSGFSRQVEAFGILHFLQVIFEHKRLLTPVIDKHDGILIKIEADSLMVIFRQPRRAVACAVEMQRACARFNVGRAPEDQVLLCVGLGYGRILRIGDRDVYGKEVNAASKLGEDTARAGEVLVTEALRDAAGVIPNIRYDVLDVPVAGSLQNYRVRYEGGP